jgi:hypothetical protein
MPRGEASRRLRTKKPTPPREVGGAGQEAQADDELTWVEEGGTAAAEWAGSVSVESPPWSRGRHPSPSDAESVAGAIAGRPGYGA